MGGLAEKLHPYNFLKKFKENGSWGIMGSAEQDQTSDRRGITAMTDCSPFLPLVIFFYDL
jgi:hypothetical protein